tara:strand:- start:116 stop:718 length:603 start_codon:yes stop_codon:yes gene_type:complete
MKKILALFLIFILTGCGFKYQRNHSEYTVQEIVERAKIYFGYDFDFQNKDNQYFFDGKKITVDSIKHLLILFKEKDYRKIDFDKIDCEENDAEKKCGVLLKIDTKLSIQSEQQKREIFERNKKIYDDAYSSGVIVRDMDMCPECKLIIIDDKPYVRIEASTKLNKIKIENIEYIAEYNKPLNTYNFGSMGKAGWIKMWTK